MSRKNFSQKAYWDKVAPHKSFTLRPDIHLLESLLGKEDFIVDYGCGYGRTLEELYHAGYRNTLGLDFSEGMIDRGRKTFPHLHLEKVESTHTILADDSVDMVLLFALLTCITEDLEQQKLMEEIRRMLKSGGFVYVMDFLLNDDERNRKRYAAFVEKYCTYGVFDLPEGVTLRHFAEKDVKQLMKDFKLVRYEKTQNKTMNGHVSNGFVLVAEKE